MLPENFIANEVKQSFDVASRIFNRLFCPIPVIGA
jgi:hypothetical protein